MKIQQIANTSISTRRNKQGDGVSFSGIGLPVRNIGMPKFKVNLTETPLKSDKTALQEIKCLFSDAINAVKNSYDKSEIKRIFVNPVKNKVEFITSKSPQLTQATKGAAIVTAGVGICEYGTKKLDKII